MTGNMETFFHDYEVRNEMAHTVHQIHWFLFKLKMEGVRCV